MKDEWWLRAAISDDAIVADLLLQLKDSSYPSTSPSSLLPPSWGLRQPRSKPSSSYSLPPPELKNDTHTRRSPTTPLSWSEDSSSLNFIPPPPSHSDPTRSKNFATDTPTTSSKRPKRKKTFAELKEEESSLLKERIHLDKEMETLRMTLEEQRSINVNLKRIKLDVQTQSGIILEAQPKTEEHNKRRYETCEAASSSVSSKFRKEDASEHLHAAATQKSGSAQEPIFVLPDLNMAPDDECDQIGMS